MFLRARKRLIGLFLFGTLPFLALSYAYWIEPVYIEVTRYTISAGIDSPLKIAHLTDLHTNGLGRLEQKTIEVLDSEAPDVIFITGDLVSHTNAHDGCREVLRRMSAPLGVWVVRGNHEIWWKVGDEQSFYDTTGASLLVNANQQLRSDVWVIGFDDAFAGTPELTRAVAGIPSDAYRIALFHSPVFFDQVAGSCGLALSGHTHGGQVRLPPLKPFWLPPMCGPYVDGWYDLNGSRMYVSRGLGTSILPIRFMCRPEVAIITLMP